MERLRRKKERIEEKERKTLERLEKKRKKEEEKKKKAAESEEKRRLNIGKDGQPAPFAIPSAFAGFNLLNPFAALQKQTSSQPGKKLFSHIYPIS